MGAIACDGRGDCFSRVFVLGNFMLNPVIVADDKFVISVKPSAFMARVIGAHGAEDIIIERQIEGRDNLYELKMKDLISWAMVFYKELKQQGERNESTT